MSFPRLVQWFVLYRRSHLNSLLAADMVLNSHGSCEVSLWFFFPSPRPSTVIPAEALWARVFSDGVGGRQRLIGEGGRREGGNPSLGV